MVSYVTEDVYLFLAFTVVIIGWIYLFFNKKMSKIYS